MQGNSDYPLSAGRTRASKIAFLVRHEVETSSIAGAEFFAERDDVVVGPSPLTVGEPLDLL